LKYEFIDLSFEVPIKNDRVFLELLSKLRYVGIAQEGIDKYSRFNSLSIFPKVSFKPDRRPPINGKNKLVVLKVDSQAEIKVTNAIKRNAVAVEITGKALSKLGRKALGKLKALSIPLIIKAKDIYSSLIRGVELAGLEALLNEYIKGHLAIAVGSGAKRANDLRHPITYVGLMIELGVPEILAYDMVYNQPKIIVRRAGYSVR